MRCLNMTRFVAAAVLACAAAPADGAELANPTGFMYYGYGQGSFGYTGAGYAPSTAGYGAAAMPAGYSGYGYGYSSGPAYPGYGYGYGGNGGYGYGGPHTRRHHHHRHCCSFGGNCDCCNSVWDGYTGCADGACCGAPVKVHRRHRALGSGAGPCVDASCGVPARRHYCHLRRRNGCDSGIGYGAAGMAAPGMIYDGSSAQPTMANPDTGESVEPPPPGYEEPQPMPADDSST